MNRVELDALLALSRKRPDAEELRRLASGTSFDWRKVAEASLPHGTGALVLRSLLTHRDELTVAADVLQYLEEAVSRQGLRMLHLATALRKISAALETEGIPVIHLKGPVLGAWLYDGDIGIRPSSDLDILVRPNDGSIALKVLSELGFEKRGVEGYQQETTILVRPQDKLTLELHTMLRLGEREFPAPETWWSSTAEVGLLGVRMRLFSPPHQLAYLASHGSQNHWQRLSWLCDVAGLLWREGGGFDWEDAFAAARGVHCQARTRQAVLLAAELLEAPVPSEQLREMKRHVGSSWIVRFHKDCLRRSGASRPNPGGTVLARILQSESLPDKIKVVQWALWRWTTLSDQERQHRGGAGTAMAMRTWRLLTESRKGPPPVDRS